MDQIREDQIEALAPLRNVLYFTRWAIMACVVAVVWLVHFRGAVVQKDPITWSVAAIAVLTLISRYAVRRYEWLSGPLVFRAVDILLVSVIVYFSDGIQSPFFPLYYIVVAACAANFGTVAALANAAVITVIALGMEAIKASTGGPTPLYTHEVVRTVPYLFLVAIITGTLRDRMNVLAEAASTMRSRQEASRAEMQIARAVQEAQLPLKPPSIEGVEIALYYKPAREVGGDFYDFYPVTETRLGLTVADAAGKGVPAALMISSAKYAMRENDGSDLNTLMRSVNTHLMSVTTEDAYVALLHGVLSIREKRFTYANGGQPPPIVVHSGARGPDFHAGADPPLGIMRGLRYAEHTIQLDPGDILLLYTDGVIDALSDEKDGIQEVLDALPPFDDRNLAAWMDKLAAKMNDPRRVDDITMMAIRLGPG